jgi:hypothetical protein
MPRRKTPAASLKLDARGTKDTFLQRSPQRRCVVPSSHIAQLLAIFACTVVLIVAWIKVIPARTWLVFSFVACMVGFGMIFMTGTPLGYDPSNSSHRPGGAEMIQVAPRLGGILLAVSLAALFAGAGLRRTEDDDAVGTHHHAV